MNDYTLTTECIKPISNIGGTIYMNICKGGSVFVPWGTTDWIGFVFPIIIIFIGLRVCCAAIERKNI